MIPFAASGDAYRRLLSELLASEHGASVAFQGRGKELSRTQIFGGQMLSVPVEGGAAILKRAKCHDVSISQHGRWQSVHLGALSAVYGKTAYFAHLYPELEKIYEECSHGSLDEFNEAIHLLVMRWLDLPAVLPEILKEKENLVKSIDKIVIECREKVSGELSILDSLFRYGKECIFGLI